MLKLYLITVHEYWLHKKALSLAKLAIKRHTCAIPSESESTNQT